MAALGACSDDAPSGSGGAANSASAPDAGDGSDASEADAFTHDALSDGDAHDASSAPVCAFTPTGDYTPPASDACDVIAQDCPEDQGCFLTPDGAMCLSAGDGACGASCTFANGCAPGLACAGSPRQCLGLCEQGTPCADGVMCAALQDRDDIGVCLPASSPRSCQLAAQDCPEGQGCYLIEGVPRCSGPTAEPSAQGQPCAFANGCRPGLVCLGASADTLVCRVPCALDGSVACPPGGGACTPIEGIEGAGVCL